ncbi:hypothetical protein KGP36_07680 [Patescibacteria group bacterium]|nr:hypothetical protein [Patescibacteria group bacterium]
MATKHEVIREELGRYLAASKRQKGEILDRLEKTLYMHRKAIIRRFRVLQTRKEGVDWTDRRGRSVYYGKDATEVLREIWEISHECCAERLAEIRAEYVSKLKRDGMWKHSDEATGKLLAMSIGTIKSRLSSFDRVVSGGGRCMTKPSSLKEIIPVRRGPWENPPPGFLEADTVAHCGNDASGEFAYTDICLTWCFLKAQMTKDKRPTLESVNAMFSRSPFEWTLIDPDSGSEFVNWHLYDWCLRKRVSMTRIRPGMKNDHGHIEQKNDKNVRKFAGYVRIDDEKRLATWKKLLDRLEVYVNHFLPSMKCVEKFRLNISHFSRRYDKPMTPYRRFMEHPAIPLAAKEKMSAFHETLNPKILHDDILKLCTSPFSSDTNLALRIVRRGGF